MALTSTVPTSSTRTYLYDYTVHRWDSWHVDERTAQEPAGAVWSGGSLGLLKIAIVNQYCDLILPPVQNSVGACTYGIARSLATKAELHVFGLVQNGGPAREVEDAGVRYRLFRPTAGDQQLMRRLDRLARLYRPLNGGMTIPRSAAGWVYPGFGRAVARALARDRFDVILFQHTSQYIPVVRRWNPHTRLILNVHHEIYLQCNHRLLARRFRHLDRVTAVSGFVARQVARTFPWVSPAPAVISNGFDTREFAPDPPAPAPEGGPLRIMYAGAISPEKGLHVLIEAFTRVAAGLPTARLDIFGPQSSRPLDEIFPQRGDPLLPELQAFYEGNYLARLRELLPKDLASRVAFRGAVSREELVHGY